MKRSTVTCCILLCHFCVGIATASTPRSCDLTLRLVLTPDVPDPRDTGFLSSLLSNHPGYELVLEGQADDSTIVVELTGPGPESLCHDVIRTIRRDGRVLSVHVERSSRHFTL